MKYLIAGLGNIGPEYEKTRHNIGFLVLDQLAKKFDCKWELGKQAYKTSFKHKGRIFILIKPTTYMNLSGKAIRHWMTAEKINTENLLVITDDIALPYETLRLKAKGSSGGHNGLKNIEELLNTQQYARLRFGVGGDFSKGKQVDYVLGDFTADEQITLSTLIDKSCDISLAFGTIGIARTMNQFN